MRHRVLGASAVVALAIVGLGPAAQAAPNPPDDPVVFASDLITPLSLALSPGGHDLYVTQNFAGSLAQISKRGAVSFLLPPGSVVGELAGVSYGRNATYHIETATVDDVPVSSALVRIDKRGSRNHVSDDFLEYEATSNPDSSQHYGFMGLSPECTSAVGEIEAMMGLPLIDYPGIVESHAYQTAWYRNTIYVADAAANAILAVDEDTGSISTVSVLPATSITFSGDLKAAVEGAFQISLPDCVVGATFVPEPVPTDVRVAKNGDLVVTTLEGWAGEFLPLSNVYHVDRDTGAASRIATGMYGATGLALSPTGEPIVAEMFAGQVSVVYKGDDHATPLFALGGASDVDVIGRTLYATSFETGEILRFDRNVGYELWLRKQ